MPSHSPDAAIAIRLLVTDSTRMGSQLLAEALQRDPQFEIVAVCANAEETLTALTSAKPDVAIVGLNLDEQPMKGLDVCRQARGLLPACKTLLLLESSKKESVLGAFGAGARGVFCREESIDTLRKSIAVIHTGQIWANHLEMRHVLDAFAEATPARLTDARGAVLLSKRQQDIVRCIAEGLTNREIAARLKLSEHTVKNYIFRIFDRLGVSTRVEMVLYAFSQRDSQKLHGTGLPAVELEDLPEVERYCRLAEFECALASARLGEIYREGLGVPADNVAAAMWFLVAGKIGKELCARADRGLAFLASEMEAHEAHEAQRRTTNWLMDHQLVAGDFAIAEAATAHDLPHKEPRPHGQAPRTGRRLKTSSKLAAKGAVSS